MSKKLGLLVVFILLVLSIPFSYAQESQYLIDSANSFYRQGKFDKSAPLYEKYIEIVPSTGWTVYINAAESFLQLKNKTKAINYLDKGFQTAPDDERNGLYYNLKFRGLWGDPQFERIVNNYKPDSVFYFFELVKNISNKAGKGISYNNITISSGHANWGNLDNYTIKDVQERLKSLNLDTVDLTIPSGIRCWDCIFIGYGNKLSYLKLGSLHLDRARGNLGIKDVQLNELLIHDSELEWLELENISHTGLLQIQNRGEVINIKDTEFKLGVPDPSKNMYPAGYKRKYFNLIDITATDNITIENSIFGKNEDVIIPLLFISNTNELTLAHSEIDQELIFQGESNHLNLFGNSIKGYVDLIDYTFPEFNNYIPFEQLKNKLVEITISGEINGDSISDIENNVFYDRIINTYKTLYNNYRNRGELNSANSCYIVLKELEIEKLKTIPNKPFKEKLRLLLNQLMGFYTDHGTNPAKAILVSTYIILMFSVFYMFFPSKWDKKHKTLISESFKDLVSKNEFGFFRPFLQLLKRVLINFINAPTPF